MYSDKTATFGMEILIADARRNALYGQRCFDVGCDMLIDGRSVIASPLAEDC